MLMNREKKFVCFPKRCFSLGPALWTVRAAHVFKDETVGLRLAALVVDDGAQTFHGRQYSRDAPVAQDWGRSVQDDRPGLKVFREN